MFPYTRILSVTVTVCCSPFLSLPAHAVDRTGNALAQPARKQRHERPYSKPAEATPPREISPEAKPQAEKPSAPKDNSSDPEPSPDQNEEVSPGDSPASCDGCELAGTIMSGPETRQAAA